MQKLFIKNFIFHEIFDNFHKNECIILLYKFYKNDSDY